LSLKQKLALEIAFIFIVGGFFHSRRVYLVRYKVFFYRAWPCLATIQLLSKPVVPNISAALAELQGSSNHYQEEVPNKHGQVAQREK